MFVTSKLWNTFHAREHVEAACQKSLDDLGLDYLDLYLIHFPISLKYVPFDVRYPPEWIHDPTSTDKKMVFAPVPVSDTWQGMEGLVEKGLARNIGLSNWNAQGLRDIFSYARIKPAVLQVSFIKKEYIKFLNIHSRLKCTPTCNVRGLYLMLNHLEWW